MIPATLGATAATGDAVADAVTDIASTDTTDSPAPSKDEMEEVTTTMDATDATSSLPTYNDTFPELPVGPSKSTGKQHARQNPIASIVTRNTTVIFSIPLEEQKFKQPPKELEGFNADADRRKFERIIKRITDETHSSINVSYSKDHTMTVVISGPRKVVPQTKVQLLRELTVQARAEVSIPREHHRFIIGKGGSARKAIEERSGARIFMPKPDEETDVIRFQGTAECIRKAVHEVQLISNEQAKLDTVKLEVLKAYHPLIAGHAQKNIKRIMEQTGARVHIPPPSLDKDEIVVSGEKVGVQQAVIMLTAIYEEKKLMCGECSAEVKKSQHRFVIGPRGKNLDAIQEKTGVVLEVPAADSPSETIILRGEQPQLVPALTMMYEFANSMVCEAIEVAHWLHRYLIGKAGSGIKELTADMPDVHLSFQDDGKIELEGPTPQVAVVKSALLLRASELEATIAEAVVKVPPALMRKIIGQKGANIEKIRKTTGAQIYFPPAGSEKDDVKIEGGKVAVAAAEAALKERRDFYARQRSLDVIVPNALHSNLIGQGGKRIREIKAKFPVDFDFPKRGSDSDIVVISGEREIVDAAEAYIKKLVKEIELDSFQLKVHVFRQYHRHIIGKGGITIKKIKENTSTSIDVPLAKDASDFITVTGREANCLKAKEAILAIQAEYADITEIKVEIDQKLHGMLIGPGGAVRAALSDEFGVRIDFPSKGTKGAAASLVTVTGLKDNVPAAKARLLELASEKAANSHTEKVAVPSKFFNVIIGKDGANIKKLIKATGVIAVLLPKAGDLEAEKDTATVIGRKEACAEAVAALKARVIELGNVVTEKTSVDPEFYKYLTERNWQFVRSLRESYGAVDLTVPKKGDKDAVDLTVKGPKDDVSAVIAKIQSFVDDIKKRVTQTVSIPRRFHSAIIGPRGATIQKLQEDFNVLVKMPKDARKKAPGGKKKDGSKKIIKKDKAEGESSKTEATEAAEATEATEAAEAAEATEGVSEAEHIAAAAATDAEPVATEETNSATGETEPVSASDTAEAKESSSSPPPPSEDIEVTGTPESCEAAIAAIKALVPQVEDVPLLKAYHGFFVGRSYAKLEAFQTKYDVRVSMPKGDADTIKVTGLSKALVAAKAAIESLVPEFEELEKKNFKVEVKVDQKHHRALIGAGGAVVSKLRTDFNVEVDFPRTGGEKSGGGKKGVITITGLQADAEKCAAEIAARAAKWDAYVTLQTEIHPQVHRKIIGPRGATVKKLQSDYSVRIEFPKSDKSKVIKVTGEKTDAEEAIEQMLLIEDEFLQDVLDREAEEEYLRPPSKDNKKPKQSKPATFAVRDAPWDLSKGFPTLGDKATGSGASGVWAAKK